VQLASWDTISSLLKFEHLIFLLIFKVAR
jgi:hypothetical protein